jgi:hypothetical protein
VTDQLGHTSIQLKSWAANGVEVSLTSEPVGEDKLCLKGRLLRGEDGLFIFRHVAADILIRPHEAVTEVALEDGRYIVRLKYEDLGLISIVEVRKEGLM